MKNQSNIVLYSNGGTFAFRYVITRDNCKNTSVQHSRYIELLAFMHLICSYTSNIVSCLVHEMMHLNCIACLFVVLINQFALKISHALIKKKWKLYNSLFNNYIKIDN